MTADELDAAYTELCTVMTAAGDASAQMVLARFALLAMHHIGDPDALRRLIAQAALPPGAA